MDNNFDYMIFLSEWRSGLNSNEFALFKDIVISVFKRENPYATQKDILQMEDVLDGVSI